MSIIISLIITLVSVAPEPFDEITTAGPVCSSTECSVSSSGNVHGKDAAELFELCNRAREDAGLDKLVYSSEISQLAYIRVCEQLSSPGHLRPDSSRFYTVFEENGMVHDAYGENIVIIRSQKTFSPSYALNLWLSSETHKKILLGEWTYSGICVLESDEGYFYAVQLFAR